MIAMLMAGLAVCHHERSSAEEMYSYQSSSPEGNVQLCLRHKSTAYRLGTRIKVLGKESRLRSPATNQTNLPSPETSSATWASVLPLRPLASLHCIKSIN